MSVRKLTIGLLAAAALLAGPRAVEAQEHLPVADPFYFDPDFRWFEPVTEADLLDMKPKKRASVGWFGSFDRMRLYTSRPEIFREPGTGEVYSDFDPGWGNRIELGYMTDADHGWSSTFTHMAGPNSYETLLVERLNRINEEEAAGEDDLLTDEFGQLLPPADRNNPDFGFRAYELQDSLNVMDLKAFELNKTWRLEPYHYGGILEPLVGFRYMGLKDRFQRQTYQEGFALDIEDNIIPIETLVTRGSDTENNMFGGQLGFRYFKSFVRTTYSADFRAFGLANFQTHRSAIDQVVTGYDDSLDEVVLEDRTRTAVAYVDNDEFVFGFEVRGEVAYQLTQHFQIRAGFQVVDLAQGLWRGDIDDRTDQAMVMAGGTFGIALNR